MNIKLRTKRKIKKGAQGSITLFMVLILLPTMVFGGVIVDTARMSMCKSAVSGAGDLAMNSQLANYDTVLKDVYGLFASSQLKTDEQITQDVTRYFEDTLVSYGVVSEEDAGSYVETLLGDLRNNLFGENTDDVSNFLNMDITNVTVKPVEDSALNNPDILRNQIVEYMKYRAPIEFGMGFFDSLKTFASLKTQSEVVDKKVKTEESTQDLTKKMEAAIKSIREYDKKFDEFTFTNSLDNNHTTYVYKGSPEFDYDHTLLRLKDKGSENYKNINRLTLIFLIKRLSADDAYLYNTNKKLIDKINNNDYYVRSGLYTPGSYNLVNENDKEASLQSIISTLNSMNYSYKTKFATNHVQDNKINNVSNASKQYANFRAEALNEDGIRKVINLLEQARYCWSSVGSELEQAKQDKQQAQTNMATYKQNVENAEGDYSDSIDTINSNDRSVDNLNTPLITDVRENGITFTVEPNYNQKISKYKQHFNSHFGVNYDNCNGNTGSNKYWVSYLNHQADGVNSQEANYIDCQSTNVGVLYSNLYDIISNVEKYNAEKQKYDAADATVTALEAKKTAYNNVLKKV